ncbi:threonylcarbamoyl-AMP synthase [Latilactobacillus sakei]|uniref:L-threonylcarbamoyladenylate synthase n=1 Tax=Latilactobacillus sakei TaxID=1599 RepID=UPI0011420F5C|nr:L-threonylcarbamoyladenylate synthase [Latilactobacillus sakei]GEA77525.1 threonylcarbamoyl-AMP synthase [Latilactobacillus sakei]
METKRYTVNQIEQAAAALNAGELVSFPTETVYGLGADATNPAAVKKVYAAKGRPSDNPLIVHVASVETVEHYAVTSNPAFGQLVKAFWPGSLTIILPLKHGAFDAVVTGSLKTAAFRMPDNQVTLSLIKAAGVPIVGPSANTSGKPSPTLADHVLHDLTGKIAGVIDDGPTGVGLESTVIDLSVATPVILRPGVVTQEAIERVIGPIMTNKHKVGAAETPKAPGMKYKHYAPNAQVYIVANPDDFDAAIDWASQQAVPFGVMAVDTILEKQAKVRFKGQFSLGESVVTASQHLFEGLRYFDLNPEVKLILVQGFAKEGVGLAYMNRLEKSAGQKYFSKQQAD